MLTEGQPEGSLSILVSKSFRNGEKHPTENNLQKQFITQAKQTKDREWLSQVSAVPLQQSVRDLDQAYSNFFNSLKGKRKGKKGKSA